MRDSTQKDQHSLKGEITDPRQSKSGAFSQMDDPSSQKVTKSTIGEHKTTQNHKKYGQFPFIIRAEPLPH